MDKTELYRLVRAQFALDLGCDPALLDAPGNQVTLWRCHPGRRVDVAEDAALEILVEGGRLVAGVRADLLDWASEFLLPRQAEWLLAPRNLRRIEAALAPYGLEIASMHQYYLPRLPYAAAPYAGPVRWYEAGELRQFKGDPVWGEALHPEAGVPDNLAVAALDESGAILGAAGASRDCDTMWQIGVHVLPQARGHGLGAGLTALLSQELLRRGIVPFYSTAGSHIFSQNVAINAGFYPAWVHLYAQRA